MITLFTDKKNCCGCTACMNICPKAAITMQADEEGFLYPSIDINKCIECGLCKKVCSFQNGYDTSNNFQEPIIYAVKNKDMNTRMHSRSGGIFVAIANTIIENNGAIYGVGYEGKFVVCHKKVENKEGIRELQGSKYVQSDLKQIYADVQTDLLQDRYVLFSGTPCQVAGLFGFLGNRLNTDKLITIDLVCHGVPSPLMWKEYIDFCEKKYKGKISKVDFRDKEYGWNTHFETVIINDKKYKSNLYTNLFYLHSMLRPACHSCKYTNFQRSADITIADFWGIDKCMPEFNDNKGVSLVLVNTHKGQGLFKEIQDGIFYKKSNKKDCTQPQLQYPSEQYLNRKTFWEDYHSKGFEYIIKKYARTSLKVKIKTNVILLLKKIGIFERLHKLLRR
ncbi:MAG: Coenzyme F420 hydrogenase/dehydrogenase, beta subunit C-terminal domain [Zhenhengia sp.]|uniref:Coenzyme F420 hydrogenase/dehydrogenase, beta subunit C-terminal domain n=1 Tax=Zhenhengia sp. TaxID=2944208 RepID=UPI0039915A55